MSVVDKIQHYQRSLERWTDNEARTLHCIDKLYKLPVTVQHLKITGVGRTVNALRKFDGSVGDAAKALVAKWKSMVVDDETSEDDDDLCIADLPESYSDHSDSPNCNRYNDDDRDSSKYKASESWGKQSQGHEKYDPSRQETKNPSSSSENSKPRENELKSSRDTSRDKDVKLSKNGTEKTREHGKTEKKSKSSRDSRESKDSRNENRSESVKSVSTSSKHRSRTEDSKKDGNRVSSSGVSNNGTTKNSNSHDSHRKRKLDGTLSSDKETGKRRRTLESSMDDESDDPDEVATQLLSRDSDDEPRKNRSIASIDSESDEDSSKIKIKRENSISPRRDERGGSASKNSGKTEKSSKSKSRESSGKSGRSGSAEKSRRDSDRSDKSKSEKTVADHRKNEKRKDKSPSKESSSRSKSHGSSSSRSKDNAASRDKDDCHDPSKEKTDKSNCDSKHSKEKFKEPKDKKVKKKKLSKDDGIDCNSGASFAEALGMCTDRPTVRKKANPVSPSSPAVKTVKTEPGTSTPSSSTSSSGSVGKSSVKVKTEPQPPTDPEPLSLLGPNVKLEPLNVDLASTLPEISPNYKPLPVHYVNPVHRKQEESKALSDVLYTKTQRTKVYSGMKSGYTSVPTLCEEAIRVLIENIHELGFTGGIPYDIIKPVLERATPDQLFVVENYNPYLIEDTDQLWQFHCNREFRTKKREEMESWRDMYLRGREEREAKLKALTANIKESIDKSMPVRSAKLAYVDKPPRNVLRQQAKYGTARLTTSSSDLKKQMILSGSSNSATNISVPPPPMARTKSSSSGVMKKNKAPLMAKALQLIKGRYKR